MQVAEYILIQIRAQAYGSSGSRELNLPRKLRKQTANCEQGWESKVNPAIETSVPPVPELWLGNMAGVLKNRVRELNLQLNLPRKLRTAGADFDSDGDTDYAVGNLGRNTKYHTSAEKPYFIYYGDFGFRQHGAQSTRRGRVRKRNVQITW